MLWTVIGCTALIGFFVLAAYACIVAGARADEISAEWAEKHFNSDTE